MPTQYACDFKGRVAALRRMSTASPAVLLNGIEYLEVAPDHRTLFVHFVHDLAVAPPAALLPGNVEIRGGERVRDPKVTGTHALGSVLTVEVESPGDFSTYRLRLARTGNRDLPPDGIDAALAEVAFSFKVDCPSDFDCRPSADCPPPVPERPQIDYLAKDYASFRRTMLDRMSALVPQWRERSPADLTVMLVELLAFRADELSYFQDAVAAESYLGTARQRTSVRRHARLLDYPFHDGCNARAWVAFDVAPGSAADGITLPVGTPLVTQVAGIERATVDAPTAAAALDTGAVQPFELLQELTLHAARSHMRFYTFSDEDCCLPGGATRAFLRDDPAARLPLAPGDVLILEERLETGETRAHAVRLTLVDPEPTASPRLDPVTGLFHVEIHWNIKDALTTPMCLSRHRDDGSPEDTASVLGNVCLADHGRSLGEQRLTMAEGTGRQRPLLSGSRIAPVTSQGRVLRYGTDEPLLVDATAPAAAAFEWELDSVLPAVALRNARDGSRWMPRQDLIENGRFDPAFVVETEDDGRAYVRVGDDVNGRGVQADDDLHVRYRIGNGRAGNVGADAIRHIVGTLDGIRGLRNPLPARGGHDPHPMDQAKLYAPQAFRRQERAVTLEDYARVAERHAEVQRAVATRRWTGSWHTIFLTVDRRGGGAVDIEFENRLRQFLERFRLAGHDLEIDGPTFVSLDLAFDVCARAGHFPGDVEQRLLRRFSRDRLSDGSLGFFHADRFTFSTPVYLSEVIARAMDTPGVDFISATRFQRWGRTPAGEIAAGAIRMGRLEIARLDNDANAPEHGRIAFAVHASGEGRGR